MRQWTGRRSGAPGWTVSVAGLGCGGHSRLGLTNGGLPKEPQVDRDIPFKELKVGTQS